MIELTQVAGEQSPMTDRQLVSFHEVVQAVARVRETREALSLVADKSRTLTSATGIAIMLLDRDRTALDVAAVAGMDPSEVVGQRMLVDDALAGHTALTGEIYVADSLDTMKPLLTPFDATSPFAIGIRSAAVVPIFVDSVSVGALAAINRIGDGPFSGTELLQLQLLANCAALVLRQDRMRREAIQRERERDILLQAARASSSTLDVQRVLQSVLTTISGSLDVSFGAVFLLNDERNLLYISADIGLSDDDRDRQLDAESGFAAAVLTGQTPYCVGDTQVPGFPEDNPLSEARSIIAVPLRARSSAEGLIAVGSRQTDAYSKQDADLLLAVAGQAAIALENALLYEEATRRANVATEMHELSQAIGATLDLDEMLSVVADSGMQVMQVDKFAIYLFDPRTGRLQIRSARHISQEMRSADLGVGEGIAGWVAEFGTPTAVQDVSADHRNKSRPIDDDILSLMSVPLQAGNRVIGVIQGMSSRRRLFTVEEMELFYTIGNQVASAVNNAQLYEDARQKKEEIRKSVRRVARALGSTTDAGKSAQVIADLAVDFTGADRSILWTLDDQGRPVNRAVSGFKTAVPVGTIAGPNSPAALVGRRGRTMRLSDLNDARCVLPDYMTRDRMPGYLGVPLKLGRDTFGVLEVFSRAARDYTGDEVRSLITFASQSSVGLKNAMLLEQASRRLDDLDALARLSAELWTIDSIDELCTLALRLVSEATKSDYGILEIFTDGGGRSVFRSGPLRGDDVAGDSQKVESALVELSEWVRRYGDSAFVPRPTAQAGHVAALAVPLRRRPSDTPVGAIVLSRVAPASVFDDDDRRLIETAAAMVAGRL